MRTLHACRLLAWTVGLGLAQAEPPIKEAPPSPPAQQSLLRQVAEASGGAANTSATPAPSAPYLSKTASSLSSNKQFTVYGGDLELRGAFCLLCEDTAAALGRVLKDNGQFVLSVKVVLQTPPDITATGPAVTLNIGELTHGGFHLQINAQLRTGFRPTDFTHELVRVLLAERILRNHQKLSTTRQSDVLPAWVMTGVTEALEYRSRSRPSALFSAVFKGGRVYSLDHILTADPTQLDALSRGIYETSTCALVLTLIDQPDGPVRFSKFLNALAVESKSDRELLTKHFPNLATSKSALEKWWSLQMASMATRTPMESMTVAETEEQLDNALRLVIPGARKDDAPAAPVVQAPAAEESAEKKSGGIFGWLKRNPKEEVKPEDAAPPPPNGKTTEGEEQEPVPQPKDAQASQPKAEMELADDSWQPRAAEDTGIYFAGRIMTGLFGGRNIIFPFKKKPKAVDETAEPEKSKEGSKSDAAAEPSKATKQDSKSAPAKTKSNDPADSPPSKANQSRSIGDRPGDLPKAPPPLADKPGTSATEPKPPTPSEAKTDETAQGKPSRLNPLNWFRKKEEAAEQPIEASAPPPKPAPKVEDKPKAERAASKPAPAESGPKPGVIPLEDFALLAKRKDRSDILNGCMTRLAALNQRAHPLYKPLITGYTAVVQELANGKTRGASTKLEELRHQRGAIHEKAVAIETYVDWYEANHTGARSHAFDDFLRLDEEMGKDRLPRNDALSKYLDALQSEFK